MDKITLQIGVVFNGVDWLTQQQKINNIIAFWSPDFNLNITVFNTKFTNIPFVTVDTIGGINNTPGTTKTVDTAWYDHNVTRLMPKADQMVFYVDTPNIPPMQTSVGIMQGVVNGVVQSCIFGINETDHAYQMTNGVEVDQGNCFELFVNHELGHGFCLIQMVPDNVHTYFYSGYPKKILGDLANGFLNKMQGVIALCKQIILELTTAISKTKIVQTATPTVATPPPVTTVPVTPTYLWDTPANARNSVRELCDAQGLDLIGKNTITACIEQESDFMNYKNGVPVSDKNLNTDGSLASTDWGICQINDHYHIGAGKDFPSVDYVLANPDKAVIFMINCYKNGTLNMWVSYSSGEYKKYMPA